MPQERFSRGGRHSGIPHFRHAHRPGGDHAIEKFRDVEDDVDAATPVDAQNASTGVWKSRKEREIPTAPTSIIFSLTKRKNEDKTTQTNCPPNRIKSTSLDRRQMLLMDTDELCELLLGKLARTAQPTNIQADVFKHDRTLTEGPVVTRLGGLRTERRTDTERQNRMKKPKRPVRF